VAFLPSIVIPTIADLSLIVVDEGDIPRREVQVPAATFFMSVPAPGTASTVV
jgi:hypothetical protein